MKILEDIINSLSDSKILDIWTCARWTAVFSEQGTGLASTLQSRGHCDQSERQVRDCGKLTQKTGLELARYVFSSNLLEASIGMATINSLVKTDFSYGQQGDVANILQKRIQDKKVTIIGHFPIVKKLRQSAKHVWVVEQHPVEGDLTVEQGKEIIPQSDVVIITGTTLINHTLMEILELCRKEAYKVLLGPSVPLIDILFDYGLDMLCGIRVIDSQKMLTYIGQGASFKQIQGVQKVSISSSKR